MGAGQLLIYAIMLAHLVRHDNRVKDEWRCWNMLRILPWWIDGAVFLNLMLLILIYGISIHPWIRRWRKRVNVERQIRFAFIIVFIFAGMNLTTIYRILHIENFFEFLETVYGAALIATGYSL